TRAIWSTGLSAVPGRRMDPRRTHFSAVRRSLHVLRPRSVIMQVNRMTNRTLRRRGFSLIELLIVIAIILIIITIAVPKYNRTQMYMRETAATAAIQTIHKMQMQYQSLYGRSATSLAELGPPQSGAAGAAAAD